jgi:hypothetical protein
MGLIFMNATIAYVTCAAIPDLDPDDLLTVEPLAALGVAVEPAIWDDPSRDWDRFDLVVLRSSWDYTPRRDAFVAWAQSVPRLANDAATIAWNTDKRYLGELAGAGIPIVATTWVAPGEAVALPAGGEWVIKPAISAGSRDTGRYDLDDADHRALAVAHVERLGAAGRVTMIQPYLSAVDTAGETALMFFGGEYSHAIRKGPLLTGPDAGTGDRLYLPETITPREPTPAERVLAARVLDQLPRVPLYARVDLVPGPDGEPLLIELELTEPSLFFEHGPGSPARFATAIAALVDPGVTPATRRRSDN